MCSWAPKSADKYSVMNRIMLRFRPIAPKPVGSEAAAGAEGQEKGNGLGRRAKRKYVRVRGRQGKQCVGGTSTEGEKTSPAVAENSGVEDESSTEKGAVTLQLLPERSESDRASCRDNSEQKVLENGNTDLYHDDDVNQEVTADSGSGAVNLRADGSVIETCIVVECVTDKFTGVGLGFSDKEKMYNLEQDACPGFISDRKNNVIWVNDAYKKMVAAEEAAAGTGFLVWLVVKEELPYFYPSFACRVKVIQHRGHGHKWNKIMPCDVWRMEFAGFAWKLDVNTALSLSL